MLRPLDATEEGQLLKGRVGQTNLDQQSYFLTIPRWSATFFDHPKWKNVLLSFAYGSEVSQTL